MMEDRDLGIECILAILKDPDLRSLTDEERSVLIYDNVVKVAIDRIQEHWEALSLLHIHGTHPN